MIQNSYVQIIYDGDYITQEKANEQIERILDNLTKLDNGLKYLQDFKVEINNKYYRAYLELKLCSHDKILDSDQIEGLILYLSADSIRDKKMSMIINKLNQKEFNTAIIIFDEDRTFLSNLGNYEEFLSESIDKHFEIIAGINDTTDISDDDGIGALSLALQNSKWSNSIYKDGNNKKVVETQPVSMNNGYELLNDNFEKSLEIVQAAMKYNKEVNISDEQRRANAENAMRMLAKVFDLEESEDEAGNDSDN